ncbi:MAG: hypothetical protein HYW70_01175 [Candidatus Nealsonbacteria bacterium]|nr:hypothetical protein [Candidatus Nealsonbacteria bacterium]
MITSLTDTQTTIAQALAKLVRADPEKITIQGAIFYYQGEPLAESDPTIGLIAIRKKHPIVNMALENKARYNILLNMSDLYRWAKKTQVRPSHQT